MLIRLPPAISFTTPSRGLPFLITSTPGPVPPLRESTEPLLSRSAGIGWRLGTRASTSTPAACSPFDAARASEAAPERVSWASTAGAVHRPPDFTFSCAEANAADIPASAATVAAWPAAADSGALTAFNFPVAFSTDVAERSRRVSRPEREPAPRTLLSDRLTAFDASSTSAWYSCSEIGGAAVLAVSLGSLELLDEPQPTAA